MQHETEERKEKKRDKMTEQEGGWKCKYLFFFLLLFFTFCRPTRLNLSVFSHLFFISVPFLHLSCHPSLSLSFLSSVSNPVFSVLFFFFFQSPALSPTFISSLHLLLLPLLLLQPLSLSSPCYSALRLPVESPKERMNKNEIDDRRSAAVSLLHKTPFSFSSICFFICFSSSFLHFAWTSRPHQHLNIDYNVWNRS